MNEYKNPKKYRKHKTEVGSSPAREIKANGGGARGAPKVRTRRRRSRRKRRVEARRGEEG